MNTKRYIYDDEEFELLLLKWMDGDLSGKDLKDFESDERFLEYQRITKETDKISIPVVDEEVLLRNIKAKINTTDTKVFSIPLWKKLASIAAIVLIVFTTIHFFNSGISVDSYQSIQLSHALPDNSQVILNSDSELSYDDNFTEDRILKLKGEAFFEVEKGKAFKVKTDFGEVSVLGTSFNVLAREGVFTVACKTGKVQVTVGNTSSILAPGNRIRYKDGVSSSIDTIDATKINEWSNGETYFERTPLFDVISSLSHKFDIEIELPVRYHDRAYTGSFIHHDLEKALKMVLVPMGIDYAIDDSYVKIN